MEVWKLLHQFRVPKEGPSQASTEVQGKSCSSHRGQMSVCLGSRLLEQCRSKLWHAPAGAVHYAMTVCTQNMWLAGVTPNVHQHIMCRFSSVHMHKLPAGLVASLRGKGYDVIWAAGSLQEIIVNQLRHNLRTGRDDTPTLFRGVHEYGVLHAARELEFCPDSCVMV